MISSVWSPRCSSQPNGVASPSSTAHAWCNALLRLSAGSYRLLCQHLKQPLCAGTTNVGALGCPVQYLLALLSPDDQQSGVRLASDRRALRITHVWEDKLCIWRPKLDTLKPLSMPSSSQDPVPAVLIQVFDVGEAEWLEVREGCPQLCPSSLCRHTTQSCFPGSQSDAQRPDGVFC